MNYLGVKVCEEEGSPLPGTADLGKLGDRYRDVVGIPV